MRTYSLYCIAAALLASSVVVGCGHIKSEAKYPTGAPRDADNPNDIYGEQESIFGEGGFKLFSQKKSSGDDNTGLGVNSFLWRATLDTLSFMPLASADAVGGTILTDWYTDAAAPQERVKINALVLGRELKADGLRVNAFRQVQKRDQWVDAPVADDTARKLEDAILTRARQLRVAHLADK